MNRDQIADLNGDKKPGFSSMPFSRICEKDIAITLPCDVSISQLYIIHEEGSWHIKTTSAVPLDLPIPRPNVGRWEIQKYPEMERSNKIILKEIPCE